MARSILVISGEASGDLHGAALIKALRKQDPSVVVKGMGGAMMRAAGLSSDGGVDSTSLAVVGISEVIGKAGGLLDAFRALKSLLKRERFDCVVLIDYPDFNIMFAAEAKKLGVPVVYYISPQIWAWRSGRIKKIARRVDKMLVVFPFEEKIYKDAGVDVEYVGHPLADEVRCDSTKAEARRILGLGADSTVVALLPGSRRDEIRRLLTPMAKAAAIVRQRLGSTVEVILPAANSVSSELIGEHLKGCGVEVKIIRERLYEALRASDAAMVTSGTVTLETALVGTPMVIAYRMSAFSYAVAKTFVRLDYCGLPNIIAGKEIVRELLQSDASPEKMSEEILRLVNDGAYRAEMEHGFKEIRNTLSAASGASAPRRAAAAVYGVIERRALAGR